MLHGAKTVFASAVENSQWVRGKKEPSCKKMELATSVEHCADVCEPKKYQFNRCRNGFLAGCGTLVRTGLPSLRRFRSQYFEYAQSTFTNWQNHRRSDAKGRQEESWRGGHRQGGTIFKLLPLYRELRRATLDLMKKINRMTRYIKN
jgi:hypothetical protein